jgi:hypothetical protein
MDDTMHSSARGFIAPQGASLCKVPWRLHTANSRVYLSRDCPQPSFLREANGKVQS